MDICIIIIIIIIILLLNNFINNKESFDENYNICKDIVVPQYNIDAYRCCPTDKPNLAYCTEEYPSESDKYRCSSYTSGICSKTDTVSARTQPPRPKSCGSKTKVTINGVNKCCPKKKVKTAYCTTNTSSDPNPYRCSNFSAKICDNYSEGATDLE